MEARNTACILVRLVKIRGPTETLDVWQHEGNYSETHGRDLGRGQFTPAARATATEHQQDDSGESQQRRVPDLDSTKTTRQRLLLLRRLRGSQDGLQDAPQLLQVHHRACPALNRTRVQLGSHPWFQLLPSGRRYRSIGVCTTTQEAFYYTRHKTDELCGQKYTQTL